MADNSVHNAPVILIVDDDQAILEVMQIVLEEEGYQVVTDTGAGVAAVVDRSRPDLVLLDIWMTGADGREISRWLKQYPPTHEVPVMLMSAHSKGASVVEEAQADGFLEKPFELDDLLERVRRFVG